jgi:hypothetical protein
MKSDLVDITVEIIHSTEKAYLVDDGTVKAWIPKSVCEVEPAGRPNFWVITIPERTAQEKGLI